MQTWFLCKASYFKIDELGRNKKVTEHYLVDAVTFIEAETRVNQELESYITGDFSVTQCRISNISEIIQNNVSDNYYKCKVAFVTLDEEKGIERKKNHFFLVQADTNKEACETMEKSLSDTMSEIEILDVCYSPILDVFKSEVVEVDDVEDVEDAETH